MRPIDADAIIDDIKEAAKRFENENDFISFSICNIMLEYIKGAPTIEAESVKRGQWIHNAGMNSKCSCCGRYFPVAEFEQRPFDVNFCIHCGAKMDGGAD